MSLTKLDKLKYFFKVKMSYVEFNQYIVDLNSFYILL